MGPLTLLLWGCVAAQLTPQPTDVGGYARGGAAAFFDAAAAARAAGAELQLRHRGAAGAAGLGSLGLAGVLPLGRHVALAGAYEWGTLGAPGPAQGTLAVGGGGATGPRLGSSLHLLRPHPRGEAHWVWDVGTHLEPWPWLAVSAGIDALNAPDAQGSRQPRRLRLGAAVRPWAAHPWLTVGADTRIGGGLRAVPRAVDSRAVVDVAPTGGLHLLASWRHHAGVHEVWAGLSLEALGVQLQGAARPTAATGAAALTARARPAESLLPRRERRVEMALGGALVPPPGPWPWSRGPQVSRAALDLDGLAAAPQVDVVVLPLRSLRVGLGAVDELRAAIARLRAAGKHVVAELQHADDRAFMVAAAASEIRLDPSGTVDLDGFATTSHFLAEGLGRLGIRFDAVAVGRYKSGPDALTRDGPRPEDAEVQADLLGEAQAGLVAALRDGRGLSEAQVAAVLQQGTFDAAAAQRAGLVDGLLPDGDPATPPPPPRQAAPPVASVRRPSRRWGTAPTVAVIPVVGTIVAEEGDNPLPGATAAAGGIVRRLDAALADAAVVGAVLRVDSPGGDVFASELIWRAARRLAAHKPLVVSMGDVAASGGYYAAMPAHWVLAEPNTVTGSIGIFALRPDLSGLEARLGVHAETYRSTPRADADSWEHPLRPEDRERLQARLDGLYGAFVGRVAQGRRLDVATVRRLAEGRVYSGRQAQALGLVDALGGLADAVRAVRERAGLAPEAELEVAVPERPWQLPGLAQGLMSGGGVDGIGAAAAALANPAAAAAALVGRLAALGARPWALWPGAVRLPGAPEGGPR